MSAFAGAMLKCRRKHLGSSVKEVLMQLHEYGIDISAKPLYGWENGYQHPDADTFVTLCRIYGAAFRAKGKEAPADTSADAAWKCVVDKPASLAPDEIALVDAFVQSLLAKRPA